MFFNTLILKQVFWKTKIILKKLEYRFIVKSTTNETAAFPYKHTLSPHIVSSDIGGVRLF